ncbi:ribonuclease 3 isoform X2 [Ceratina calcarata]|nr:ribonuclease 3 isoform X2 [Ceratina calcarata]
MANFPPNMGQPYFWGSAVSQPQNMKYYPVPQQNLPPPNFPPPNYRQPPPSYNMPVSNLYENRPGNFAPPYNNTMGTYYQNEVQNTYYDAPYQDQTDVQYDNQNYGLCNYSQSVTGNYNSTWDDGPTYQNNGNTEWSTNTYTSDWYKSQENRASWYETNKTQEDDTKAGYKRYNDPPRNRRFESRSRDREPSISSSRSSNRRRSRSRERSREKRSSRSPYRSRHESQRDSYSKHSRNRSTSRERLHGETDSERRSLYRRSSHTARSPRSFTNCRNARRSRSLDRPSYKSRTASPNRNSSKKDPTERELLLEKYRQGYCATSKDMERKMDELSAMGTEGIMENARKVWTRTAPADLYYTRDETNPKIMNGTPKLHELCDLFKNVLLDRAKAARNLQTPYEPPPRKTRARLCRHKSEACSSSSSDSESSMDEDDRMMEELMAKKQHPHRLHPEMWFNDPGEMNDGPLCRCSAKSRRSGIRHGIYAGEGTINKCDLNANNADKLYHYRITISPPTNFLTKTPTIIKHDEHEFIFEGFSMLSHFPIVKLPTCKVIRFNIEYTILYIDEKLPENFTIRELDYFQTYLFQEILELVDFDLKAAQDREGCGQFHFMPRFVRDLADNGQEILSMNEVLNYLIKSSKLLIDPNDLSRVVEMPQYEWQNIADEVKGMIVTYPAKKPCSVRVDQLDRNQTDHSPGEIAYPEIVHFGIRPPQLSYAGNADYQKAWRDYVKFRHLLANMPKPSFEDKRKLEAKENKLQELRTQSKMKRDVTVDVSSEGFYRTGIMCDIVQHAMLIPVLVCHLRFHKSLDNLERTLGYAFKNRYLLQLALTHPSYRENFGTNPDHARNSLTNCGIRQPEYGDRRIHYMNTRKRGINTLINIMSRFGARTETESSIAHNERLEFLGDAVVEFLTSIHLFHMFPDLEEGGLATYRAAIVQNQHLAVLAKKLNLEEYMLYAHGSDLCHDLELRHAMANCFEALMGSLFLDGGIEVADRVFGETLFKDEEDLAKVWVNYPKHPLQEQEPTGDRQWIPSFELLQKLTEFEESIGIEFTHIRLLARAFTDRSIGYTNLTLGSNQRLEFLGDTVLQLIVSEYLYKYFPEHHEGHLSLLRSSLVNNKTQAVVCDDLGMTQYALYGNPKAELKTKDRADLLEAFLGALYVDKGLEYCQVFCDVCFFPRLQDFIMNQDWNDPKSKLQQCCLTLRTMDGGEPDIPVYK